MERGSGSGTKRVGSPALSPALRGFLNDWQPRQRRTLGMLNAVLVRLQAVVNAHPEWAEYDLLTHLLAALHLVIENDRLIGGHTEEQIADELAGLVAQERPEDPPAVHRAIAEAVVDVLTNARNRRLRLRDRYMHAVEGAVVFQNLYQFDPSDRAAAERYRSQRMLQRAEYDEVLSSVERRATSVHGLRGELEALVRRIGYNVRDVDYVSDIIPRLDEVLDVVSEQVEAEEKFADAVADLTHHAAPDLMRLQRIRGGLRTLISALGRLQSAALATRQRFEAEQDRQLFTFRRITINPQAQLLEPLLGAPPAVALDVLAAPLAVWLGPRRPAVLHLGAVVARSIPVERGSAARDRVDPFDLGDRRAEDEAATPALLAGISAIHDAIDRPVRLAELLTLAATAPLPGDAARRLPWALAVTIASAYGYTGAGQDAPLGDRGFDHDRLVIVSDQSPLPEDGAIVGDDVLVVPRRSGAR
jgi:hypothetical protein